MSGRTSTPRRSPGDRARVAGGGTGTVAGYTATRICPLGLAPVPVPPSQLQDQGIAMADDWPLQDFLELGALPSAVPSARLHARQLLWEWGLTNFSETVELLLTELMTNAVKASQSLEWPFPVRLWLLSDKARILILVWDANHQPPVRMDAGEEAEGGRGLLLVEALSDQWNWYVPPETGGKMVWALCRTQEVY